MDRPYLPPAEFLRECFLLDEATGVLTWRHRPDHHFPTLGQARSWNTKYAGSRAGVLARSTSAPGRSQKMIWVTFHGVKKRTAASRVIFKMVHETEPETVDHINGDPLDDRPSNLRGATAQENQRNNAGYRERPWPKGVFYRYGKFEAVATRDNRTVHLGKFKTPAEAHEAWKAWARQHHGEFFNPGPERLTIFD